MKKSRSKQPNHILDKEKKEMIAKLHPKKIKLAKWRTKDIEAISNNLDFNFKKSFTRKFNGYIKTLDEEKLIAFRRIDRGNSDFTSRITAISSEFEIFFDQNKNNISIFFNNQYIGSLSDYNNILNPDKKIIGELNRNNNEKGGYYIYFNNEKIAFLIKNSERRNFLRNPFYDKYSSDSLGTELTLENEVSISKLVKLYRELNETEYKWVLSLVVYEAIFYGIDFTQ
jgi:hypothetical protein